MNKTKEGSSTRESIFQQIVPYSGKRGMLLPVAVVFSALSAVCSLVPFYYIWKISLQIFSDAQEFQVEKIKYYAFMVFAYSLGGILLYFISLSLSHWLAFEIETSLKKSGFARVMQMPMGFFHVQSSGKIRKVINDGAAQTHTFLAHQMPDMAGTLITPLMVLGIFFVIDWRFGLAALIPIVLSFLVMSMMMTKEGELFQKEYTQALEEMSNEAVEYVRAIPVVKTFGQSVKSFTRFYNSIENYKTLVIRYTKLWTKPYSAYLVIVESTAFFLIPVSILIISNNGNIAGVISNFILYILLAPQISLVLMRSMYFTQQKLQASQAIKRIDDLFVYKKMEFPEKGAEFLGQEIEFRKVSFSYEEGKKVLDQVSFKVGKGETLALVGASGSGKTTIAGLAARFWDVDEGEVLIGGRNIKEYSKEVLMDKISFVFQNSQLFKTSLRENIAFGREIGESELEQALLQSRSKELIDRLPDGLDTVIGKKGTYLSGGEQQRIALARAFLKNAPIVLLDEATAFADPENEHLIQAALKDLSRGKTTVMIAHRMSTVRDADAIAVIENGRVAEYGNHETLMEAGGLYKKMWEEYQSSIAWNIKKGVQR